MFSVFMYVTSVSFADTSQCVSTREGDDIGLFNPLVPKVSLIIFSYSLAKQIWGVSMFFLIGWLIMSSVQTFQLLFVIYRRGNFVIIIGDLHQFIGHFVIPLVVGI